MRNLNRRRLILAALMGTLGIPAPARAGIVDLKGAAELVTALTQAILALPDLVRKSVQTKRDIEGSAVASDTRRALIDLSRRLSGLVASQNAALMGALDRYLGAPSPAKWARFESDLTETLRVAGSLERSLAVNDSDLVLQGAYRELMRTLQSRALIGRSFIDIPPPSTPAEMAELRRFATAYRQLVDDLGTAIDQLNRYIATLPR